MEIEIVRLDHTGNGIGYINNKVVFVPKSIPGDRLIIKIVKTNKRYLIGEIEKVISRSSNYITSRCPYYEMCGGCNISNLEYKKQLEYKEEKIKNIFKKYLNKDIEYHLIGSKKDYNYRNKITYHIKNNKIGLIDRFNNILEIDNCLLVSDKVNSIYNIIKREDISKLDSLIIKECDNGIIVNYCGELDITNIKDKCIAIYQNNKEIYSKEEGYIYLKDIKYNISAESFFQINTSNIEVLYDEVLRYGNFKGNERVIDLYCGVGSISLYISKYVKEVLGIEIVNKAIEDANKNKEINNINNVKFICNDVSKEVDRLHKCDILIVDPPRPGLDNHTRDIINNSNINKLIYVSCDPMTLVRDIKEMNNYDIKDISIIDMFPQTAHVECVSVLCRKDSE